ncbi:hypothetical protein [Peribacillus simplex]|nr:hypothetical protein [Peribacillus simplex]WHY55754.1 hypothetical protein QNH43_21825 [Peribacillus simplex]
MKKLAMVIGSLCVLLNMNMFKLDSNAEVSAGIDISEEKKYRSKR